MTLARAFKSCQQSAKYLFFLFKADSCPLIAES